LNEKLTSISECFALWFVPFTVNTAAALKLLESRRTIQDAWRNLPAKLPEKRCAKPGQKLF